MKCLLSWLSVAIAGRSARVPQFREWMDAGWHVQFVSVEELCTVKDLPELPSTHSATRINLAAIINLASYAPMA
ncbi:hypothetical protein HOY80DRAFT_116527 [Tuber brumale]|nr:hypothetical protein HOY80DRAFT_116527 [Tuber brumale]